MTIATDKREAHFWSKVDKAGTCWLWKAGTNNKGYGTFYAPEMSSSAMMQAHRYAWIVTNGPIPDGLCLLHRCDTPRCVNPGHLFLGTQADNMRDCANKGRINARRKLQPEDIATIKKMLDAGHLQREVASIFGVSQPAISYAVRGINHKRASFPRNTDYPDNEAQA